MLFFPEHHLVAVDYYLNKDSLPGRFVNWIAACDNQQLNPQERMVQWIMTKFTGKDPYARTGFERGCTIAKRVGIVVGSGLAAAGGLYLAGKGLEHVGNGLANSYNMSPVPVGTTTDGKDLCEHHEVRTFGRRVFTEKRIVDCDIVKRTYEANERLGDNIASFGKNMQSGAKQLFAGITVPFYMAYALPKKLFSMMPAELHWLGKLPEVNIQQKVNDLFAITTSAAEAILAKQ